MPGGEMWQEILKTPHLVRLTEDYLGGNTNLTLIIRCDSLRLKYIVKQFRFEVALIPVDRVLVYALKVEDGDDAPFIFWSPAQSQAEISCFHRLLTDRKVLVHLYNESCTHVASVECDVELPVNALSIISSSSYLKKDLASISRSIHDHLTNGQNLCCAIFHRHNDWTEVDAVYITNAAHSCRIRFLTQDEGRQQEELLRWLADSLSPEGAYLNPQIHEPSGTKEFTDLILASADQLFVFMSKTLAIFARKNLPSRSKLRSDILKDLRKDARKIRNQCRKLHAGERIFDLVTDKELKIPRCVPINAICIIPDLSLISECREYNAQFARSFADLNGDIIHILDPTQLFRTMQAAHMIADSSGIPRLQAFASYLRLRSIFSIENDVLDFDMTLNLQGNEPSIGFRINGKTQEPSK